mmetsp:Transcript_48196/g.121417  ORF Transcript_48196/g.121417 Transcript_48196/m.121417 type:complete len:205 (+) Transcript_48196:1-615(+)
MSFNLSETSGGSSADGHHGSGSTTSSLPLFGPNSFAKPPGPPGMDSKLKQWLARATASGLKQVSPECASGSAMEIWSRAFPARQNSQRPRRPPTCNKATSAKPTPMCMVRSHPGTGVLPKAWMSCWICKQQLAAASIALLFAVSGSTVAQAPIIESSMSFIEKSYPIWATSAECATSIRGGAGSCAAQMMVRASPENLMMSPPC